MKRIGRITYLALCLFIFATSAAALTKIQGIRLWPSPEGTRLVFDLSGPIQYEYKQSCDPFSHPQIVIDLKQAQLAVDLAKLNLNQTRIKRLQGILDKKGGVRMVLELRQPLKPNSFSLPPNRQYGHRLVFDLEVSSDEKQRALAIFEPDNDLPPPGQPVMTGLPSTLAAPITHRMPVLKSKSPSKPLIAAATPMRSVSIRPFIVAIDAGHGGEDPGAVGRCGTREKDVVLAISKYLKQYVDEEPGMQAVLIRSGDYYIGLYERVARARKKKADLFISVHADAFHDRGADGISVFTLSEHGASSAAAKWLADRENRSDLIGGLQLKNKNKWLASVLLDLSQSASQAEGVQAATHILQSLKTVAPLHKSYVEQAGFAVLKAPDVPSLLIETGFISHPTTEKKLRSSDHQKRIAKAIMAGIRRYALQKPR